LRILQDDINTLLQKNEVDNREVVMQDTAQALQWLASSRQTQMKKVLVYTSELDDEFKRKRDEPPVDAPRCTILGTILPPNVPCPICTNMWYTKQQLGAHLWKAHRVRDKRRACIDSDKCIACGDTFASKAEAQRHFQLMRCAASRTCDVDAHIARITRATQDAVPAGTLRKEAPLLAQGSYAVPKQNKNKNKRKSAMTKKGISETISVTPTANTDPSACAQPQLRQTRISDFLQSLPKPDT
jgi:hypothetical protein